MGAENYVHRLLGTMIGLCGDELLWKVHKKMPCGPPLKDGGKPFGACLQNQIMNSIRITSQKKQFPILSRKS